MISQQKNQSKQNSLISIDHIQENLLKRRDKNKEKLTEYGNLTGFLADETKRTNSKKKKKYTKQIDLSKIIPRLRKNKK